MSAAVVVDLSEYREHRAERQRQQSQRLTRRQLCLALAISDSTLRRWHKLPDPIPAENWAGPGRRPIWRYVLADVLDWRERVCP